MIPPSGREHEQYIPGEQVLTVANLKLATPEPNFSTMAKVDMAFFSLSYISDCMPIRYLQQCLSLTFYQSASVNLSGKKIP